MKLAWCTDIHLNFLHPNASFLFGSQIKNDTNCDAVVITGDIAESNSIVSILKDFQRGVECPVYFVLGNHDYYHSSIMQLNARIRRLKPPLIWLDKSPPIELNNSTALIGCGGWADARNGFALNSKVEISDHQLIVDFVNKSKHDIVTLRQRLGQKVAKQISRQILTAWATYTTVVVATHVPPFQEVHLGPDRNPGNEHWQPWFTARILGDELIRLAKLHPNRQMIVLCGHTHTGCEARITHNIKVFCGQAEYCVPKINRVFGFDDENSTLD